MKVVGIILIVVGVLLTAFTSMNFFSKDKIVDAGNLELSKNKTSYVSWSPFVGVAILGGGVLFLVIGLVNDNKGRTTSATIERTTTTRIDS